MGFGIEMPPWYPLTTTKLTQFFLFSDQTDIVDKELKQLRNGRWEKAFSGEVLQTEEAVNAAVNRKATIVIEHSKSLSSTVRLCKRKYTP